MDSRLTGNRLPMKYIYSNRFLFHVSKQEKETTFSKYFVLFRSLSQAPTTTKTHNWNDITGSVIVDVICQAPVIEPITTTTSTPTPRATPRTAAPRPKFANEGQFIQRCVDIDECDPYSLTIRSSGSSTTISHNK